MVGFIPGALRSVLSQWPYEGGAVTLFFFFSVCLTVCPSSPVIPGVLRAQRIGAQLGIHFLIYILKKT